MSFRRAAKVDANQAEIVEALRKNGWYVLIVSQLKNCCDVIASKKGRTVAIEIKDGSRIKSERRLTEGEQKFKKEWQGEYALIEKVEDIKNLESKK